MGGPILWRLLNNKIKAIKSVKYHSLERVIDTKMHCFIMLLNLTNVFTNEYANYEGL